MSCKTDIESEARLTFFWNVENYSYCWQAQGIAVFSPAFEVGMMENTTWQLVVYPNANTKEGFICYFLKRACDDDSGSPEIKCDLGRGWFGSAKKREENNGRRK
ncbi:hypothetical protein TNCV_1800971 [Trichonephila clavipes]|nr:hypothetical protein TNCV_1800971 [Trichonephila clavipes]